MASTYSDLKFELIGTGEQSGTWGTTTNTNLGTAIQEAITGSADVTFASGTVTLTLTNTNASQTARNLRLNLTGTSGGAQDLIVPTIEKFYLVNNGCADAITVKNSTGTGIAVPAGKAMLVFNNATNVVEGITYITALETSTATIGTLTLTNALAVAQGGTGATTADTALDNLGGTTVGKAVFKAANAAAAQQAMDTEVGVDVQAYDAGLTDIAGLAVTDGNIIVGDGTNWVAENGATARTSLGLGSIATQASSSVTITGGSITGITDLAVADGGTGQGSYTDGELLIGNTTGNTLTKATLTAGTGISVTNGSGSITIAAAGGGGASPKTELFTAPGTWTQPAGASYVEVIVIGGGGGSPADSFNPAGNAGGTSSFGALLSATGGNGSTTGSNTGNPGNGTVSAGTTIKTTAVLPKIITTTGPTGSAADQKDSAYNPFKSFGGIAGHCGGNTSNNLQYSTSTKQIAGSAGWVGTHHAGGGGVAWASYVPVTGPVAVTIGNGGNSAGPIPSGNEGGSVRGAVLVKWWE
jgi:hypothetical protein